MDLNQEVGNPKKDQEPTDDEWESILDPSLIKIKAKEAEAVREKYARKQWEQLRWLAKHNLFFLSNSILGYERLSVNLHAHLCKWIQSHWTDRFLEILLPRNHFKSTIDTI